jgi:hypothetical protein
MMDFGHRTEPIHGHRPRAKHKKLASIILLALILLGAGLLAYNQSSNKNPLPDNIKHQITYKVLYPTPKAGELSSSYSYQAEQKTLSFLLKKFGSKISITEQPAPDSLGSGNQIYFQALGIHPYAQFVSKLGPVALTKFWESNTLDPKGQSGILVSKGTLLIAHPDKALTNDQWKQLFNSLKIAK